MASAAVQSIPQPPHYQPEVTQAATSRSKPQIQRHDVITALNYYKDPGDGSEPRPSYVGRPETYERPAEPLVVTVHDIRGSEAEYSLDKNGFQLYKYPSQETDFLDDDKIRREYYPETEQLLKDATGASQIFIFDHTIRRNSADRAPGSAPLLRGPVQRVHIDQSYQASLNRVSHHLPEEAERLLKGRVQIINVWRPIKTIYKDPLAVADAHSVPDTDLVPVGLIYPDRRGETYTVRPNKSHTWYYAYGQTPEEVTLIKCFDTKTDGRARRVPHTAFVNPETEDREPRESIEVRALVFHADDTD